MYECEPVIGWNEYMIAVYLLAPAAEVSLRYGE